MVIKKHFTTIVKNKFLCLFFFIFTTLISFSVNAQESPITPMDTIDAPDSGAGFVALVMAFILLIASIAGVVFIFQGLMKLIGNAKNPNDPKNSLKSALLAFIAGALLTNTYGTASIVISSITGSDGFCFNQHSQMEGTIRIPSPSNQQCFDGENSELTSGLRESLTTEGSEAWDQFRDRMEIFLGVIQLIGMYYFIKSIFLLKSTADGRSDVGYGKILVMMIFSSIAMDLDNAIGIIINTIQSFRGG